MSSVPNRRAARIRALRGAADLLDSALDNGDGWAFDDAAGDALDEREARRVVVEIEKLAASLRARADALEGGANGR